MNVIKHIKFKTISLAQIAFEIRVHCALLLLYNVFTMIE